MIRSIPDCPDLSVVVPLYNEAENVDRLVAEISAELRADGCSFEIIMVDDGSDDGTWLEIQRARRSEPRVRGLSFLRNFGHQSALLAGIETAEGRSVITMDADLQHPPAVIPELLAAWREGHTVVHTERQDSPDTSLFKRWTSAAFYRVFSLLSGLPMRPGMSDFRLLDRSAVEILLGMKDPDLFLRGSLQWIGGPAVTLSYRAGKRHAGSSKFTLGKMVKLSASALVSFSTIPLKLGIWLGLATSGLAFLEILYIVWAWSHGETVPGWASVLTVMSFMFGVLFILLGILGTYLASIHGALKQRPAYLVGEVLESGSLVREGLMTLGDGTGRVGRYVAVGVSNTVVSFSLFQLALGQLGQPAFRAQAVAYAVGIVWSFFWNRRWTFRHSGAALPALAGFLVLQVSLLLFSSALLGLLIDVRHHPPTLTWIWVMALVTGLGYLGSSRLVFRPVER